MINYGTARAARDFLRSAPTAEECRIVGMAQEDGLRRIDLLTVKIGKMYLRDERNIDLLNLLKKWHGFCDFVDAIDDEQEQEQEHEDEPLTPAELQEAIRQYQLYKRGTDPANRAIEALCDLIDILREQLEECRTAKD